MSVQTASRLVTVPEAGEALGVSESTVWRLIRRGALPSVRREGRRMIPRDALVKGTAGRARAALPLMTPDHPIFRLVGAGRSGGLKPGARDKHAILDD